MKQDPGKHERNANGRFCFMSILGAQSAYTTALLSRLMVIKVESAAHGCPLTLSAVVDFVVQIQ